VLLHLQLGMCFILLGRSFSQSRRQLDRDFPPRSVPIISRLLLLGIRVFRGPKLLQMHCRLNGGVLLVGRMIISLIDTPIHAPVLIRLLQLYLPLPVEPILFLLLSSRTMFMGRSTMLLWKKPRKL
jgi:hypothetical protein